MNKSENIMNNDSKKPLAPKFWKKGGPEEQAYLEWRDKKQFTGSKLEVK